MQDCPWGGGHDMMSPRFPPSSPLERRREGLDTMRNDKAEEIKDVRKGLRDC